MVILLGTDEFENVIYSGRPSRLDVIRIQYYVEITLKVSASVIRPTVIRPLRITLLLAFLLCYLCERSTSAASLISLIAYCAAETTFHYFPTPQTSKVNILSVSMAFSFSGTSYVFFLITSPLALY